MNLTKYAGNEGRGRSWDLWRDCPREEIKGDFNAGYYYEDDFMDLVTGKYTFTDNTAVGSAATFALSTSTDCEGGVALLSAVSTTSGEGGQIQSAGLPFYMATAQKLWFECRIAEKTITTAGETFIGLHEIDTTILASGALTGANMLGFSSVSDDNILLFTGEKATVVSTKASHTLVEDTYVKLGFKVGLKNGVLVAEQFINGVYQTATDIAAASIPALGLVLSAAMHGSGTAPIMKLDWWSCFVEKRS